MFCSQCGQRNPDGAKFCYQCGARMQTAENAPAADLSLAAPPPSSLPPTRQAGQQPAGPGTQTPTTPLPAAPDYVQGPPPPSPWNSVQTPPPAYPQTPPPPPAWGNAQTPPPAYPQTASSGYPQMPPPPPAWDDTPATSRGRANAPGYAYIPAPGQALRYAGFWRRFFASWIDSFIIGLVIGPIYALVAGGSSALLSTAASEQAMADAVTAYSGIMVVISLIFIPLTFLYYCLMESSGARGTLGKLILGIRVTDLAGQRISFGRALGRNLAKMLSGLILGIGYLMVAFTARKQALHDMIAGCVVVRK